MSLARSCAFGALADDPMFKYRCAEHAFQRADYAVAQKFYGEVVTNSPPLRLAVARGILDSMLCMGQWAFARQYVDATDFSQFESVPGYGELMLRICFILVKNRHFVSAENIFVRVDFAHLRDDMRSWYHLLNSLVLHDRRKFEESNVELELAKAHAKSDEQLWMINFFNLQNIVSEVGSNTAVAAVENSLKIQILSCKNSPHSCDATKLYSLFLNNVGRRTEALNALEECLQHFGKQEDVCAIKLYRALVSGILSKMGLADVKYVLLSNCNVDTKLLAFKLLVNSVKTDADATLAADFLDFVLTDVDSDLIKRSIFLAKIAIFLSVERFDLCSPVASKYINSFSMDGFFKDIYELLACIALGGNALEYRNSAHYLDKLRASVPDNSVRVAVALKIADAFFYNHDFKLASDMYGEVLKLNSVEKCGHALVNQVLSDVALGNYEEASAHINSASGGFHEKLDAIVEYLGALKRNKMYDEALKYIDSLKLENVPNSTKYTIAAFKAKILLKKKQCVQALVLASKICDELSSKINSKEYSGICSQALFIKGCAAYKLKDFKIADEAFGALRVNFRNTEYSTFSLFKEAKFLHKSGDLTKAISVLELCEDVKYLPYANYRIALLKFRSGLVGEATELLEQIIHNYPDAEIAAAARIIQGDILRAMGDFSNAQFMYGHALNFVSNTRDINYLSLVRAKCLIAQKNRDSQCLETAINVLENLYSNPGQSTSFRLECAAEYCLALKLQGKYEKLQEFAFDVLANVDDSGVELTKKSRYWLLQILFILRDAAQYFHGDEKHIEALFEKYNVNFND
jgi:tetratricopeptide (TPR) repeat protein